MRIALCGSINCSDRIIEIAEKLEKMGNQVELPFYTKKIRNGEVKLEDFRKVKNLKGDSSFREKATEDLFKRYWRLIKKSDCILVVNVEKNGLKNYIGGNTFLEMGFAYVLDKKIFLLNNMPNNSFLDEIKAMKPVVLNGNLKKIKV